MPHKFRDIFQKTYVVILMSSWEAILKNNFDEMFFEFVEEFLLWGNLDNRFINQSGGKTEVRTPLTMEETDREERPLRNAKGNYISIDGNILIGNVVIAEYSHEIFDFEEREPQLDAHINYNASLNNTVKRKIMTYFENNISGEDLELWKNFKEGF